MPIRGPLFSPGRVSRTRVVEGPPRLQGSTLISEVSNPQRLTDWPLPKWPRQLERGGVSANLLMTLLVVVVPFSQTDWPLPKEGLRTADVPVVQNLQLTTLVPAADTSVFSQFHWPLPQKPVALKVQQQQNLLPVLSTRPFTQSEWLRWTKPQTGQQGDSPNLLATTLAPAAAAAAPFSQQDWPVIARAHGLNIGDSPNLLLTVLAVEAVTGRSKDYSIGGIPIPFTDEGYDSSAARREQRRQILHEDQIVIDVLAQAVTSGILK